MDRILSRRIVGSPNTLRSPPLTTAHHTHPTQPDLFPKDDQTTPTNQQNVFLHPEAQGLQEVP
jgi:hypothetical protein